MKQYLCLQILFPLYFSILSLFAPSFLDKEYMSFVLVGVLIMIFCYFYASYKIIGNKRVISIRNMFLLFYIIVYFQFAVDFVLGCNVDMEWIYRSDMFCSSLSFSALCLSVMLVGFLFPQNNIPKITSLHIHFSHIWLFVLLSWLCFGLFVKIMGFSFFIGGYGSEEDGSTIANPSAARFFNYMQLFLKCTLLMIVWNAYNRGVVCKSILAYIKLFPTFFIILYFSIIILWLTAGGRAVSIMLFLFWFCGYLILSKKDISWVSAVIIVVLGGVFFTFFKMLGGLALSNLDGVNIVDAIARGYDFYVEYNSNATIFSPTRELSFSVYTYNVYYYLWNSNQVYGGIFLLLSLIGTIPGVTPLLSNILEFDLNHYYLAKIVTDYANADKGLGSACVGELLCDVGFLCTIAIFFLVGILFRKLDSIFQKTNVRIGLLSFIIVFSYFSQVFFIPRGSLLSGLFDALFMYVLIIIYACVSQICIRQN